MAVQRAGRGETASGHAHEDEDEARVGARGEAGRAARLGADGGRRRQGEAGGYRFCVLQEQEGGPGAALANSRRWKAGGGSPPAGCGG